METVVGRGTLVRAAATAGMFGWILLHVSSARAAELPGARLTVMRTAEAASCPDESTLARDIASRMTARADRAEDLLLLSVSLAAENDGFSATIRVDGRKQGTRTMQSKGPTCEGLREALMISLLLLLDEHPVPLGPPAPRSQEPPVPSPPSPPGEHPKGWDVATSSNAVPTPPTPPPTLWVSAGGALTHGFPESFWGVGFADLAVRYGALDASVGGVLAPLRRHALEGGRSIAVLIAGGRARACYAFLDRRVRFSACALTILSSLTGRGTGPVDDVREDSSSRRWWLVGAGPEAYVPLSSRIGIGISGSVLAQTRGVSFHIDPNGGEYATDPVVGWIGADVRLRIW